MVDRGLDRPPGGQGKRAEWADELVVFADDWGRHPSSAQRLIGRLLSSYPVLWVNTIGTRRPTLSRETLARGRGWLRRTIRSGSQPGHNPRVITPLMWPGWRAGWEQRLNTV